MLIKTAKKKLKVDNSKVEKGTEIRRQKKLERNPKHVPTIIATVLEVSNISVHPLECSFDLR